ncbi:MAG: 6-phosphofructokinase [Caldithrix sp. RBG_13_44_9]|nr:MAG: 6-phosphofructokinase [Caldithrix sp. RBG_13_44_9]
MAKKRIGILTGGGDCPGLNAVIRGVTKTAIHKYGLEVIGFYDGFLGLIENRFIILNNENVSGILTHGGTILGTSNKANPFEHIVVENGETVTKDVSNETMELYKDLGLDALIAVGGDGTMTISGMLSQKGANVVGVPKTIDKDLMETDTTFGFDTARSIATEAIDRLHTTAQSHHRVMLVEVMGRNAGWLALESGIAGGGDIILLPEIPYDIEEIIRVVRQRSRFGKRFSIIVVAEGARPEGGDQVIKKMVKDSPEKVRLGGIGYHLANQIENDTQIECRVAILGHLQRGGTPTALDRILATQFAVKAMELVVNNQFNQMVALKGNDITAVPFDKVMGRQKLVPKDSDLIEVALAVGTNLGQKLD